MATAVEAAVYQLCIFDDQLHDAVSMFNLVLKVILKQLLAFLPLHGESGLRKLTAQSHTGLLLNLLVPQLCLECDGRSCNEYNSQVIIWFYMLSYSCHQRGISPLTVSSAADWPSLVLQVYFPASLSSTLLMISLVRRPSCFISYLYPGLRTTRPFLQSIGAPGLES